MDTNLDSIDYLVKEHELNDIVTKMRDKTTNKSFDSYFNHDKLYCKNICNNIKRSFELPIDESLLKSDYIPPSKYGLENSEPILPNYYFPKGDSIKSFDYLQIIKDDIRNMRKLNEYQINYIKTRLYNEDKNDLFDEFNKVLEAISHIL
jgi:hypothetical protein